MAIPLLGAALKGIGGAFTKKAISGAAKGAVKRGIKGKAKDFITGKNKKKKGGKSEQGKGGAIVRSQSSPIPVKSVSASGESSLAVYSPPSSSEVKSTPTSFSNIEKTLDSIVGKTTSLKDIVEKQYKTKKKLVKKARVAADKENKAEREDKLEGFKKFVGGTANKVVSPAKGLFDMIWSLISNVLMGGLLLGILDLVQKNGLRKGLADSGRNILIWRRAFQLAKGALVSLFRLGKTIFGKGFDLLGKGFKKITSAAGGLSKTFVSGVSKLGKAIVLFARKSFKFVSSIGKSLLKGKNLADATKIAKKSASKVKPPKSTPKSPKVPKAANNIRKFTRGSSATKGATSATKGAVGKAAGKFKGLGKLLPGLKFGGKAISRIPVIGPLITLGINLLDPEITVGRAAFRAAGAALGGGITAAITGAASGGLLGVVGLLVGEIVGEYLGDIMWISLKGGGLGAVGNKITEDIKKALNVGKKLYDWTAKGLSRFYEGMPKIDLEESLINTMSALPWIPGKQLLIDSVKDKVIPEFKKLVGFDGKFEIPDIGWMLNPFNVDEKFGLFSKAFFGDQPVQDGELKKTDKSGKDTSRDSLVQQTERQSGMSSFREDPEENAALQESVRAGSSSGQAGGAVESDELYKSMGFSKKDWDTYRNTVAQIESGGEYNIAGGSGGHYDGRYQLGSAAKSDGARYAGIENPGHSASARESFRSDPELQEKLFTGFTKANHSYLMRIPEYKNATPQRKLQILGYAHNQGMGGAEKWMRTGEVGSDGFGTKGTKYTDALATEFRNQQSDQSTSQSTSQDTSQSTSSGSAYASGLRTGPSERIGGSSEYHIDTKFKAGMSMEQKIQMMDQLSQGYAEQGRVIEFSNSAVQNKIYNHTMTYEEKSSLLKKAFAAHNLPRGRAIDQGGFNSIDYYVPLAKDSKDTGGRGRFRKSVEQAEVLVPTIDGGKLEYHQGGGYGSFVVGVDKDGNVLYKTGHGDTRTSSDRGTVKFGKPKPKPTPSPTPRQSKQLTIPTSEIPAEGAPQAEWDSYLKRVDGLSTKPPQKPTAPIIKPSRKSRYSQRPQKVSSYPSYESSGVDMIALLTPIPSGGSGSSGPAAIPGGGSQGSVGEVSETSSHMSNKYFGKSVTAQLYKFG